MADTLETKYYRDPATDTRYRVRIVHDEDPMSPRDADNPTVIHTFDAGYYSPEDITQKGHHDSIFPSDYHGSGQYGETRHGAYDFDLRRARKYAALDPEILAVRGLDRSHDGTLRLSDNYEAAGYIAITRKSWEMCMGDVSDFTVEKGLDVMRSEIEAYNRYARGEYVGVVVEEQVRWHAVAEGRPDSRKTYLAWEDVESLWGIDDQEYALTEALSMLPEGVEGVEGVEDEG